SDLASPRRLPVIVDATPAEDIDYHQVFAASDLHRDYWTRVGTASEEQFYSLAETKLEIMGGVGLSPESSVLDRGCGTGQVAVPLETFLTERGCYYGVDIAPAAIAYCKERFERPNFHFAQSGMTPVPITQLKFDFIVLFSVFTHTYVDETKLLLGE